MAEELPLEAEGPPSVPVPSRAENQPSLDGLPSYESAIDNPPDCDVRQVFSPGWH